MNYNEETRNRILSNLRESHPDWGYTDEQLYAAWDQWSESEDYPDEDKIPEWID